MSTPAPARSSARPFALGVLWLASVLLAFLAGTQVAAPGARTAAPAASPAPTTAAAAPAASATATPDPKLEQFLRELPRRQEGDPRALGRTDAKVVLTNWSDYRCPFCARWHTTVSPELKPLVDDGTLRIEFRDLAIFGEQSERTAVAARAAGQQGRFWPFQDAVFAAAPPSGHPDIDRAKLLEFARAAGVPDLKAFEKALDDPALLEAVRAESAEAQQLGISGTPFFVVGTKTINGAQPAEVFLQTIRSEAAR